MTPKKYLMQVGILDRRIEIRLKQLEDMKEKLTATGGTDYSRDRVKESLQQDTVADRVIYYMYLEDKINALIDEYIDIRDKITEQISGLEDARHIDLLSMRYLEGLKLQEIAKKMGFEYHYTCKLHGEALRAFGQKYLEQDKQT